MKTQLLMEKLKLIYGASVRTEIEGRCHEGVDAELLKRKHSDNEGCKWD